MRFLPFSKGKNGFQFAGGGVSDSGGGGGGGSYTLPPATSSTLGGVKIGSGVEVTSDGTISVSGGGGGGVSFSTTETVIGSFLNDNLCSIIISAPNKSLDSNWDEIASAPSGSKIPLFAVAVNPTSNFTTDIFAPKIEGGILYGGLATSTFNTGANGYIALVYTK